MPPLSLKVLGDGLVQWSAAGLWYQEQEESATQRHHTVHPQRRARTDVRLRGERVVTILSWGIESMLYYYDAINIVSSVVLECEDSLLKVNPSFCVSN